MEKLSDFVSTHINDDTTRLILDRKKYPQIDIDLAVACIESRKKLKDKVHEWYNEPGLIFPLKLSAEQCSSSATGEYKSRLAADIINKTFGKDKTEWIIADLTGGLGVDTWFFSQKASKVIYYEMQEVLCDAAKHNFKVLKAENIEVNNAIINVENISSLINPSTDLVYIDPARRSKSGNKVFLIEDCTPDVLTLKDEIFRHCRNILVKLSPMADITMVCQRLGTTCREVHVVAAGGECKELLIWMDREWNAETNITAVEIHSDQDSATFSFTASQEKAEVKSIPSHCPSAMTSYLFEPGKALMKAAPFNLIASRFGIQKLGKSTHYYLTDRLEKAEELKMFGKVFCIREYHSLDKRSIKEAGKKYPRAEVTARNIPMDTDTLRKKLGITSGDDAHIFGLKSDHKGNLLIIAERI